MRFSNCHQMDESRVELLRYLVSFSRDMAKVRQLDAKVRHAPSTLRGP